MASEGELDDVGSISDTEEDEDAKQVVAEAQELLEGGDADLTLSVAAKHIFAAVRDDIRRLGKGVNGTDINADLVFRCIAVRQIEAFESIITLTDVNHPYPACTILRPMCEDLIFAKWFATLAPEVAKEYIQLKTFAEIMQGIIAQEEFFPKARKRLGAKGPSRAEGRIDSAIRNRSSLRDKLKHLGERNGWGKRDQPSVRRMAELSDSEEIYDFFYHATSAAAHSSFHHMLRMVWGNADAMSISNHQFDQYHHRFALTWGTWLLSEHIELVQDRFDLPRDEKNALRYDVWLDLVVIPAVRESAPPVVTSEELKWRPR